MGNRDPGFLADFTDFFTGDSGTYFVRRARNCFIFIRLDVSAHLWLSFYASLEDADQGSEQYRGIFKVSRMR